MSNEKPTIEISIETPNVPNFLFVGLARVGQNRPKLALSQFTDEQLEMVADQWKQKLLYKARQQRNPAPAEEKSDVDS